MSYTLLVSSKARLLQLRHRRMAGQKATMGRRNDIPREQIKSIRNATGHAAATTTKLPQPIVMDQAVGYADGHTS